MKKTKLSSKLATKTKQLKSDLVHYSEVAENSFERFKKGDLKKLWKIFKKYR
jgi:hypothetical protein